MVKHRGGAILVNKNSQLKLAKIHKEISQRLEDLFTFILELNPYRSPDYDFLMSVFITLEYKF